jgi:hypothetical protein
MIKKLLLGAWHQLTDAPKGDAGLGETQDSSTFWSILNAYARRVAE